MKNEELTVLQDDMCPKCRKAKITVYEQATEVVENAMYVNKHNYGDGVFYDLAIQETEYLDKIHEGYSVSCSECGFEGNVTLGENFQ